MLAIMRYRYLAYRVAIVLLLTAAILNGLGLDAVTDTYVALFFLPAVVALMVFVVNAVWTRVQNRRDADPVPVRCPVHGVWIAWNSPSSRVPSHGTDQFGQRYALDLTAYPDAGFRGCESPTESGSFGSPVMAGVAGDVVGLCGNSGNSTEPHVHVQLSDRRSLSVARGVPMVFADTTLPEVAVGEVAGIPRNGYTLTATRP